MSEENNRNIENQKPEGIQKHHISDEDTFKWDDE